MALGLAAAAKELPWPLPPLVGGDAFFLIYLALMARFALWITPDGLRRRASVADEGIPLIAPAGAGCRRCSPWPRFFR